MRKCRIGVKLGIGFGLIFVLLLILSLVTYRNVRHMSKDAKESLEARRVLGNISSFEGHISSAETGQRGYLVTGNEEYLEPYNHATEHAEEHLRELKAQLRGHDDQRQNLEKLEELIHAKLDDMKLSIDMVKTQGLDAARKQMSNGKGKQIMDGIREVFAQIAVSEEQHLKDNLKEANRVTAKTNSAILWIGGIGLLLIIILTYYFTVSIVLPLQKVTFAAEKIASGDLQVDLEKTNRKDEVGMLVNSLVRMSEVLQKQFIDIKEGISVLSTSTSEIMSGVAQLAASATQTATAIGETTTTIEQVKQTAEVSNSKAGEVSAEGKKNAIISDEGNKAVIETVESMHIIKQKMDSIATVVLNLSELSHTIGEITATVNDLAEQSNILAVNAAIEAAKAGDQGRGFAVVAQEIKNLSLRSKEATSEVRSILSDVQKSISKVVMSTEDGGRVVDNGMNLIKATREAISKLSESTTRAAQASIQIASSSQQQLIGMDQVVIAMENISESSSQIAATTQETNISVNSLHQLGERLQEMISYYKVSK
ncbi:MAG: methyl-accepting chemotaxis protein [Candidatus Stygibacter frigidus]|nr:methyl-accepting chemotaxis protein [Candidatus Stygibacter frigidus]